MAGVWCLSGYVPWLTPTVFRLQGMAWSLKKLETFSSIADGARRETGPVEWGLRKLKTVGSLTCGFGLIL